MNHNMLMWMGRVDVLSGRAERRVLGVSDTRAEHYLGWTALTSHAGCYGRKSFVCAQWAYKNSENVQFRLEVGSLAPFRFIVTRSSQGAGGLMGV